MSGSWQNDKHPCLIFVEVHKRHKGSRRLMMIKTKNQMTDHQDVQVEDSQKNLNLNLNNHVIITYDVNIVAPPPPPLFW